MQKKEIYAASLIDKNQFITNGYLNMRLVLEKFVQHFHDLYGDSDETFLEDKGKVAGNYVHLDSQESREIYELAR